MDALSAFTIELPRVEGAPHAFAHDPAAMPQVGSKMRAEGIQDSGLPRPCSEKYEIFSEVMDWFDVAFVKVPGPFDSEPAVGDGKDVVFFFSFCHVSDLRRWRDGVAEEARNRPGVLLN